METTYYLVKNGIGRNKYHVSAHSAGYYEATRRDDRGRILPCDDAGLCGRVDPTDCYPHVSEPRSLHPDGVCRHCIRLMPAPERADLFRLFAKRFRSWCNMDATGIAPSTVTAWRTSAERYEALAEAAA